MPGSRRDTFLPAAHQNRDYVVDEGGPTKFELVISTKTAKALGLIPQSVLLRADEVIQ